MNTTKTVLQTTSNNTLSSATSLNQWKLGSALALSSLLLVGCGDGDSKTDLSTSNSVPENTTVAPTPGNDVTEVTAASGATPAIAVALVENQQLVLTSDLMPSLVFEIAATGNDFIRYSKSYMPAYNDGNHNTPIYSPANPDSKLSTTKSCLEYGDFVTSFNRLPQYIDSADRVVYQAGDVTTVEWNDCTGVVPGLPVYYSGKATVSILEGFYGGGVGSDDARWSEEFTDHMHRGGASGPYVKYINGDFTVDIDEKVVAINGNSFTRLDQYCHDSNLEQHFYRLSNYNLVLTNTYQWKYWTADHLTLNGTAQLNGSILDGIVDVTFSDFSSKGITLGSSLGVNGTVHINSDSTTAEIEFVEGSYTWRLDTDQDGNWDWQDTGAF